MTRSVFSLILSGAVLAAVYTPPAAFAQGPANSSGAATFALYASRHGPAAKGDGPLAAMLKTRPADLTSIASHNRGTFPAEQVAQIIDGRHAVKGHGRGDMPVWGDAFAKSIDTVPVEEKIKRLVAYLERLQAKPASAADQSQPIDEPSVEPATGTPLIER